MSFARVGWFNTGYSPRHVDDYFDQVQQLLDSPSARHDIGPEDVRSTKFPLVRNGYDYRQVDAALDRIELQALERQRVVSPDHVQIGQVEQQVDDLLDALAAPRGQRFTRGNRLQRGYAAGEVDSFIDRLAATLRGDRGPGLRAVRQVEFHAQLGGYSEDEVDEFLDGVVDVLLRRLVRPEPPEPRRERGHRRR